MKIQLPQYSGKDYLVLSLIIIPFTLLINSFMFGGRYFSDWQLFLSATLITAFGTVIYFIWCGWIAVTMRRHFPYERQATLKLAIMMIIFIIMTGLFLYFSYKGYEAIGFFNYRFNEKGFIWAYICTTIVNIFITLLLEAISRFEDWRSNLKETEQLKQTFKQSQLHGLKSQVNPHFLFNSLNTLSSLINEDEEKAERFLNEMTKVYRYMLRGDDEQLVTLASELKFLESYQYLLESRFGGGLKINSDVNEETKEKLIPALALQAIVEDAITRNAISKNNPLVVSLGCDNGNKICIKYNRQEKVVNEQTEFTEDEIKNLINKYALLNQPSIVIEQKAGECCVYLPLIENKKEAAA